MKLSQMLPEIFSSQDLVGLRFIEGHESAKKMADIIGEEKTQEFSDMVKNGDIYNAELDEKILNWIEDDLIFYQEEIVNIYREGKLSFNDFVDIIDFPDFEFSVEGPGGMSASETEWICAFIRKYKGFEVPEEILVYLCFYQQRALYVNPEEASNYLNPYYEINKDKPGFEEFIDPVFVKDVTFMIIRGAIRFHIETWGDNILEFEKYMRIV